MITGLIMVLGIGLILLACYFMTKWERAVFPGNQKNGKDEK